MKPQIVPATSELIQAFYGETHRQLRTMRALVAVEEDKPIAVIGYFRGHNTRILFSDSLPWVREKRKKVVVQLMRQIMEMADKNHWKVVASTDDDVSAAGSFLEHFGFTKTEEGVYIK